MEYAFRYGIWEILKHDLIPETQLLAAIGYGTDLFSMYKRPVTYHTGHKIFVICVFFERVCNTQVEWENTMDLCMHTL